MEGMERRFNMLYKMETKDGQILLERGVIAQLAEEQLRQFRGKVWITNAKGMMGGLVNRISGRNDLDELDIDVEEDGVVVRIYLVIRFGVSIRMVTDRLIADIRRALEEYGEIPVKEVSIVVTGTLSKHIARRNIEVKG